MSVSESTPGPLYPATLRADIVNGVSAIATVAVVVEAGDSLSSCTGSNGPPPSIDFGLVQASQLRLCNFSLQNPGAQAMTISTFQATGTAFQISSGPGNRRSRFQSAARSHSWSLSMTSGAASYTGSLAIELARTSIQHGVQRAHCRRSPLPRIRRSLSGSRARRHAQQRLDC